MNKVRYINYLLPQTLSALVMVEAEANGRGAADRRETAPRRPARCSPNLGDPSRSSKPLCGALARLRPSADSAGLLTDRQDTVRLERLHRETEALLVFAEDICAARSGCWR